MNCTRRAFLTAASGVTLGARMAAASVQGANSRVRIGIIGTGGRARGLMNQLKSIAGVEIVAICDVFEPRLSSRQTLLGPRRSRRPTRSSRPFPVLRICNSASFAGFRVQGSGCRNYKRRALSVS